MPTVASGRIDDADEARIVTGAGPGASYGPHVRGFRHAGSIVAMPGISFYAFAGLRYGANVASGALGF